MKYSPAHSSGFTLIELLIAVALVGVVSIVGFTATNTAGDNQLVRQSAEVVSDTFQRASIYSQNARDERTWGVRSQDQKRYVIISQLTDGSEFEELQPVTLPSGITFTQPFHVLFTRGTGYLEKNHEIVLTTSHDSTAIISLTTTGKISIASP